MFACPESDWIKNEQAVVLYDMWSGKPKNSKRNSFDNWISNSKSRTITSL